jgi:hypothetical protein
LGYSKNQRRKDMPIYEIEFKRTSYVTLTVEASSKDEAETAAWEELAAGESYGISGDADWQVKSIEKLT